MIERAITEAIVIESDRKAPEILSHQAKVYSASQDFPEYQGFWSGYYEVGPSGPQVGPTKRATVP